MPMCPYTDWGQDTGEYQPGETLQQDMAMIERRGQKISKGPHENKNEGAE